MLVAAIDRLDEPRTAGSGTKVVATGRGDITKCRSRRGEPSLQPAVYKSPPSGNEPTQQKLPSQKSEDLKNHDRLGLSWFGLIW